MNADSAWFWTDSLCLDQDSHSELNVQVAHMGDIYSRAAHVLSWLGESEGGVDALNIMADFLAVTPPEAPDLSPPDMRTPAGQHLDRAWIQLTRLEGSEYWQVSLFLSRLDSRFIINIGGYLRRLSGVGCSKSIHARHPVTFLHHPPNPIETLFENLW